jgi:hypothetical protein
MTATLTSIENRVRGFLSDTNATAYPAALVDEAIRQAVAEYSRAYPRQVDTILTTPGAGREIALDSLPELDSVLAVYWPFDPTTDVWPPNRVSGFRLDYDDGNPILTLTSDIGDEPQASDTIRILYATPHHLDGLDGAAGTTIAPSHESTIVLGAAGTAAIIRAGDVTSTYTVSARTQANLEAWGAMRLAEFHAKLAHISAQSVGHGPAFSAGWRLDQWENQGVVYPQTGDRPRTPTR